MNCAMTQLVCCAGSRPVKSFITVKGKPVAQLTALAPSRRRWLSRVELSKRLKRAQADPGLRSDLAALAGDTTDDLGPIQ